MCLIINCQQKQSYVLHIVEISSCIVLLRFVVSPTPIFSHNTLTALKPLGLLQSRQSNLLVINALKWPFGSASVLSSAHSRVFSCCASSLTLVQLSAELNQMRQGKKCTHGLVLSQGQITASLQAHFCFRICVNRELRQSV